MFRPIYRRISRQASNSLKPLSLRRLASSKASFNWEDPLASQNLFTEEEIDIAETAESYCQEQLQPRVLGTHTIISLRVYF
jgi:glutaryl-CoA dehydrogenase